MEIVVCVFTEMKMVHRLASLTTVVVVIFITLTKGYEIRNNTSSERSPVQSFCVPHSPQIEPVFQTPQDGLIKNEGKDV